MICTILARAANKAEFYRKLSEGDPIVWFIVVGGMAGGVLIGCLALWLDKRRGQHLADTIGDCEFVFWPDGLFRQRFFVITGAKQGVRFTLEARKTSQKRVNITVLKIEKPTDLSVREIASDMVQSRAYAESSQEAIETPDALQLIYPGVGADGEQMRILLDEVATSIVRHTQVDDADEA